MNKKLFLGVDTSNYTTSLALCDEEGNLLQSRRLLPVKDGECGLRQSDAVFLHTKVLPQLASELSERAGDFEISAVGVSSKPRWVEGSYMPCFLAGVSFASAVSAFLKVPLYEFSHQQGHVSAALSTLDSKIEGDFIAFHLSGGTSEILYVSKKDGFLSCDCIGGTNDLNAGQVIDRVGVNMGLVFPCGRELDRLSSLSNAQFSFSKTSVRELECSFSGVENKCKAYYEQTRCAEDTAKFLFCYIADILLSLCKNIRKSYPGLPIVFSGGVASNSYIREKLSSMENLHFASAELSSDNACGIALLCKNKFYGE